MSFVDLGQPVPGEENQRIDFSSTSRKDRVIKYRLYEHAGVKYYCIVDPETNSATVFVLKKDKFRAGEEFKDGHMRFDLGPCEIQLDFGEIFKSLI